MKTNLIKFNDDGKRKLSRLTFIGVKWFLVKIVLKIFHQESRTNIKDFSQIKGWILAYDDMN